MQLGAPLVAAATGLTLAAIVCRPPPPALPAATHEVATAPAPTTLGGRLAVSLAASGAPGARPWALGARGRDLDCLSAAVYYEARGESAAGQAAVAQVVLNRARAPAFPKSVCAVVFQPGTEGRCQFSFVCDGAMTRPLEPIAWRRARQVASRALQGYVMPAVGRALNFHAADAPADPAPGTVVARLGGHVFYVAATRPIVDRPAARMVLAQRSAPRPEPQTVEDGPGTREVAGKLALALGDLGAAAKPAAVSDYAE